MDDVIGHGPLKQIGKGFDL